MKFNVKSLGNTMKCVGKNVSMALKKRAPEIMMIAGATATVAGGVIACKQTLKINDILDSTKEDLDKIHTGREELDLEVYSDKDYKQDLTKVYFKTGMAFVKLYGPSVVLTALGLTTMFASNNILKKRNASLLAAYTTLESMYKRYRKNVVETYGEDVDRKMRFGIKEVEEEVVDEKGKKKKVKKETTDFDPNAVSDYARFFGEYEIGDVNYNINFDKEDEYGNYNRKFLLDCQRFANEKLRAQGYLFLNDVYKMLGYEPTEAGQDVGWIYDEINPIGDNKVDFRITDPSVNYRAFNGYEKTYLLDFNVDGYIRNKCKLRKI